MKFLSYRTVLVAALPFMGSIAAPLKSKCRPGGNFDLSKWELQTSIKDGAGGPLVVPGAKLSGGSKGCANGWQDPKSFFTQPTDGSLVINAPGYSPSRPCPKFSGSKHCRTELGETSPKSWSPSKSKNRLHVKLVGIRGSEVCVGQVFPVGGSANKPLAELYYHGKDGVVSMGVATCAGGDKAGCKQEHTTLGTVPLGTAFSYEIRYEGKKLMAGVNGKMKELKTYFSPPTARFKVGNYNQGTDDASLRILELTAQHS